MLKPALALLLAVGTPLIPTQAREPADSAVEPRLTVRYAGLTSCGGRPQRYICSPWRLWLRGGGILPLPDAQVRALDENGRELRLRAPIAVDPYGQFAAYFHKSTHRLAVRDLNARAVRLIPGTAGKRPSMTHLDLLVSPKGRYLVVDPDLGTQPTTVIETATGATWSLPDYAKVQGFTPDGSLLRVILDMEETAAWRPGTPPPSGGVTVVGWSALRTTGDIIAGVSREGRTHFVRFYAARTAMEHRRPLRFTLPRGQEARRLDWTPSGHLTLLTLKQPGSYVTRSLNPTTGKLRTLDTFTISPHTWDIHLAGE
ncbi:hypothetical protein ACIBG7_31395 [Nonomuraea sp. NPDC050328]|uniref:hypothetical protein n=1 Tax=Nonomuraea sp. NPDC050328 TaxID=3364361 RepID=UPI00379ACFFF